MTRREGRWRSRFGVGLGVVLVAGVAGTLALRSGSPAGPALVALSGEAFHPARVVVTAGAGVTWLDDDRLGHTVTADDGSFDSDPRCRYGSDCMQRGDRFRFVFTQPGAVRYYCRLHGGPGGQGMSGEVVVRLR